MSDKQKFAFDKVNFIYYANLKHKKQKNKDGGFNDI